MRRGVGGGLFEAGPLGDAGLVAVGGDEVAGAEGLAVGVDEMAVGDWLDALDGVSPVEADAEGEGAVVEELVEDGAADAASGGCGEAGFGDDGGCLVAEEADAAKGCGFRCG